MRFAELDISVKQLRSSAGLGGRLQRPSPCRVRSAHWRERGRFRARQARSCNTIACRGGIPEILIVSSCLQRLNDLQQLASTVLNFAVAYSRAFVLLDVCRAWAFVCFAWRLQSWTNETRPRGAAQTPLALPYPFRTWPGSGTWAERDKREVRKFLYFGQYTPELFLNLGIISRAWTKTYGKIFISKLASFPNWLLISSPRHFFHGHTSKRLAYYCRTTAMSLLFDIRFHGQISLFECSLSSRGVVP